MLENVLDIINKNPNVSISIFIIFGTIILSFVVHRLIKNILSKSKRPRNYKKIIKLEQPLLIIIIIMGAQAIISTYLRNYPSIHHDLNNLLVSVAIIIITYILSTLGSIFLENWSKRLKKERSDETHEGIVPLLKSVINILLGLIGLIFILQTWDVSVGALLTSLGIAGVIIGFAFRDTLTNVFGGISLILDDTFRKGDLIELSDGEIGFVIETSLRSTKIKNYNAEEIHVPNSLLANMKLKNYAQPNPTIRIKILMPVAIGTDISKVEKILFKMLDGREDILKYPEPRVYFVKVQDHFVELAVCFYIQDYHDLFIMKSEMSKEIYALLLKNKIEIPYPARKIYYDKKH